MIAEAKFKPVQSPRWTLVSSALLNVSMKQEISKDFINFRIKSPCANLNPLFKTFWRLF